MISVVFPHLLNEENNKCLELSLKMLKENTSIPYEILYIADNGRKDMVYKGLDWLIRNAKYDNILWHSSDIVYAKDWDKAVVENLNKVEWMCLELVECGQIGVHPNNIHLDFGITADTFRREDFEKWVKEYSKDRRSFKPLFTWYSPSVFRKDWYISMGGFSHGCFPDPLDADLVDRARKKGAKFITVNSFAYHFQLAGENIGTKPPRCTQQ